MEETKVDLNNIFELLDPVTIAQRFGLLYMGIRETYVPKNIVASSFNEFMAMMADFFKTLFLGRLNLKSEVAMPTDYSYGFARDILDKAFQGEGGIEYAYYICKTGVDGGIKTLLDRIYYILLKQDEERYANFILDMVIQLDWDSKVELMRQYLRRFGNNIPNGYPMKNPEQLAPLCEKIIRDHVQRISELRIRMSR